MLKVELEGLYDPKWLNRKEEYLADKLEEMRITLIREEFKEKKYIDDAFYSIVDCLQLECLSKSCVINGITFTANTDLYKITISPLINGVGWNDIKFISTIDMETRVYRRSIDAFIEYEPEYAKPQPMYTKLDSTTLLVKNLPYEGMQILSGGFLYESAASACNYKDTDHFPIPSPYKIKLLVKKDMLSTYPSPQKQTKDDSKENPQNAQDN